MLLVECLNIWKKLRGACCCHRSSAITARLLKGPSIRATLYQPLAELGFVRAVELNCERSMKGGRIHQEVKAFGTWFISKSERRQK